MSRGLAAGLVAAVPDHRQQARDRIRPGYASAEHIAVDVRRNDQAGRPVRHGMAGACPEPPVPARRQRTEEERTLPRAAPVDLAVIPRPGLGIRGQRLPQVQRDPTKLIPLPSSAGAGCMPPYPRGPGENGHSLDATLHIGHSWDCRRRVAVTEPTFDAEGLFDEDYLYFYAEPLDARSDAEAGLIWHLLELEPGMEVLDLACGHGRIANALAERGCRVTGLDATPLFLDQARLDAAARGVAVTYVDGDMRDLPWTGRFDRVINWFTAFGYFDDAGNRRVLTEVARALKPGGRFALEMSNRDWIIRHFEPAGVDERDGNLIAERRRFEPLTGRMVAE